MENEFQDLEMILENEGPFEPNQDQEMAIHDPYGLPVDDNYLVDPGQLEIQGAIDEVRGDQEDFVDDILIIFR